MKVRELIERLQELGAEISECEVIAEYNVSRYNVWRPIARADYWPKNSEIVDAEIGRLVLVVK